MKLSKLFVFLLFLGLLLSLGSCSAEKDIAARRNFMMPEKSDLPRNQKYQASKKKKTYKPKKKKKRKVKSYTYLYTASADENQLA